MRAGRPRRGNFRSGSRPTRRTCATHHRQPSDAFCAAFLSRWLADIDDPRSRRPDLARAADFAARTAAKVVTRLGARPV